MSALEKIINAIIAMTPRRGPSPCLAQNARLIAHRGAHDSKRGIHENTLEAFQRAMDLGCWGIELDVHATRDGVLVVHHDPTLERLWQKDLRIAELDYKALKRHAPRVPALAEVVERFSAGMHLFIELKSPFNAEEILYKTLKHLTPCADYHLLSLDAPLFKTLTLFPAEAKLLVPWHNNVEQFVKESLQQPYGGVLGHYLLLTHSKINRLKAAQQQVGVGFIDSKFSLYRELNRGMEWIFTNNALPMSVLLNKLQENRSPP